MKRNPASYMADPKRHKRHSIETNGLMARGGRRKGRVGRAGGGRLKRSR